MAKPERTRFAFTGPPVPVGDDPLYPYPATENWQKAIGAHVIWMGGDVQVDTGSRGLTCIEPSFRMRLVIHAEDQYNFNPSAKDITTGIPDSENGRFVIVDLAKGYRNEGTARRTLTWKGLATGVSGSGGGPRGRQRQPDNNRRASNRI